MALRLYPIVAVSIYCFQYTYGYQFLLQFGVAPEEVGVSQLKLLSRAALFALVVAGVYGVVAGGASVVFLVRDVDAASKAAPRSGTERLVARPRRFVNVILRDYAAPSAWRPPSGARRRRMNGHVVLGLTLVVLVLAGLVQGRVDWGPFLFVIVSGGVAAVLARRSRELGALICLSLASFGVLAWAAFEGGTSAGSETAETGEVPALLQVFGVDVRQVTPVWLNSSAQPKQYRQQDLVDLGSAGGTVFLYDCATQVTHRVPLTTLTLDYSLADADSSALNKRLKCK